MLPLTRLPSRVLLFSVFGMMAGMEAFKLFTAMKAFVVRDGKILILRESDKYADGVSSQRYDVVGGRVKPGERFDAGLIREIQEETGLRVVIGKPFFVNEWRPIVRGEQWQIVATFFECQAEAGEVTLSNDHDHYFWIEPQEYKKYDIIANLEPAFTAYLDLQRDESGGV